MSENKPVNTDDPLEGKDPVDAIETPTSQEDTPSTDALQEEQAQAEIIDLKEQVLRAHAETQNTRRRSEQDVEKAHKFGQEKLARELLAVIDNLERAITSAPDNEDDTLLEGVKMTLQGLISTLDKFMIKAINPKIGEAFNPEHHQAMSMQADNDAEPNTLLAVMQKGYTLHGRLLRPAMVVVSKKE
jgi:molecular chaperone GrpE